VFQPERSIWLPAPPRGLLRMRSDARRRRSAGSLVDADANDDALR